MMNRYLTSVFPKIPFNTVSCFVLLSIIFYSSAITAEQPTLLGDVEVRVESVGDQVRLTAVDTPDGMITYGYDNDGRLSSLTYPDHGVRHYHYENTNFPSLLTAITDKSGGRITTDRYDGVAKIAFYGFSKSNTDAGVTQTSDVSSARGAVDLCPNTVFDDGMIWSGDLQYVSNVCVTDGQICVNTFFAGLFERFDAVCSNNEWQLANPTPEIEALDRCPNAVFDNGRIWNSEIELVNNSCSSEERTCPDTFFSSLGRYLDAVCTSSSIGEGADWQPLGFDLSATNICPNTIYGDGSILSGDFQVVENSCSSIRQVCPNTWFSEDQEFSGSVCTDGKWQKQPKGSDVLPPLSEIDINLPIGGSMGVAWSIVVFGLLMMRRKLV